MKTFNGGMIETQFFSAGTCYVTSIQKVSFNTIATYWIGLNCQRTMCELKSSIEYYETKIPGMVGVMADFCAGDPSSNPLEDEIRLNIVKKVDKHVFESLLDASNS